MMLNRLLKRTGTIISDFCVGAAYGLLLSLAPVALINHRHLAGFLTEQDCPKLCFYLLSALTAGISAVVLSAKSCVTDRAKESSKAKKLGAFAQEYNFEILATIAAFLFTACAALCQKLNICALPAFGLVNPPWPTLGFILISLAMICQFASIRSPAQNRKPTKPVGWSWALSEPVSLAWIVLLSGVSLLFATWFPLIALPGIFIGMKWKLNNEIEKRSVAPRQALETNETSS